MIFFALFLPGKILSYLQNTQSSMRVESELTLHIHNVSKNVVSVCMAVEFLIL